jgi:nitrate/TMAO reductase-like tetraheme cytochrome c subunit
VGLPDGGPRYRPKPRQWYRSPWLSVLVVAGLIAVVVVVVVIPVWATDTPSYCMSCKATRRAGHQWETSTHAKVSCVQCHEPPGFANAVKWRAREWLNVWADYLNVSQLPNHGQRPGNANCLRCHSLDRIPDRHGDIRMPHRLHVELRNLTCVDCHDTVAHPGPGGKTGVSMSVCTMCHNEQGASADCTVCHITPPPKNVHPKDYLQTHGAQALADEAACMRCHHSRADFCNPCHANPPPDHFSGTWRYTHGPKATRDPLSCIGCHDKATFCEQCHRVSHPTDWVGTHGRVAAQSPGACLVCHPRAMCDTCHEQRGVVVTP